MREKFVSKRPSTGLENELYDSRFETKHFSRFEATKIIDMFKIAFQQLFDNFNVNFRKKEDFLTSIPCILIPEYSHLNAPLVYAINLLKGTLS